MAINRRGLGDEAANAEKKEKEKILSIENFWNSAKFRGCWGSAREKKQTPIRRRKLEERNSNVLNDQTADGGENSETTSEEVS